MCKHTTVESGVPHAYVLSMTLVSCPGLLVIVFPFTCRLVCWLLNAKNSFLFDLGNFSTFCCTCIAVFSKTQVRSQALQCGVSLSALQMPAVLF